MHLEIPSHQRHLFDTAILGWSGVFMGWEGWLTSGYWPVSVASYLSNFKQWLLQTKPKIQIFQGYLLGMAFWIHGILNYSFFAFQINFIKLQINEV